jgi:hypothetical protein
MRFALHVTLTVQERLVYASLSGFGVDQHSRQRKGIVFIFFVNVAAPQIVLLKYVKNIRND